MKLLATPFMVALVTMPCSKAFGVPRTRHHHRSTQVDFSTADSATIVSSKSTLPSVQLAPPLLEKTLNLFQIWAIQNPQHILSKVLLPPISLVEGLLANQPNYLDRKRAMFGHNFCCAGEVVLGDFSTVEQALTQPQARTYRLGTTVLDRNKLMAGSKKAFALALSDPQITKEGYTDGTAHTDVIKLVRDLVINEKSFQRQEDNTAKRLLQEVARDYAEMDHSMGGAFFTAFDRGLQRFLVRYQHYVLFGLDPDDKPKMDLLTKLYYESQGTAYFLADIGSLLQLLNVDGAKEWPQMWEETKTIYKESPAFAPLLSEKQLEFGYTVDELIQIMLPLLGIAALPGPLSLAKVSLGGAKLPAYEGHSTEAIDPALEWDKIPDLNNRVALENHIYEAGRLWAPVSATHRVAIEDFTVPMYSSIKDESPSMKSFPAGTIILIPMSLGMLEEGFWGPTTYEFDTSRQNLCPFSMLFNSVGNRSNGRICPGKDLTINLRVDLLRELGQVRRTT